jgi:hypothetical protein
MSATGSGSAFFMRIGVPNTAYILLTCGAGSEAHLSEILAKDSELLQRVGHSWVLDSADHQVGHYGQQLLLETSRFGNTISIQVLNLITF